MKIALGAVVVVGLGMAGAWISYERAEAAYQADADAKRVNDTHRIAELLEAYRLKAGHLPFDEQVGPGKAGAITVLITSASAERDLVQRGNPLGPESSAFNSTGLLRVLRPVLGDALELPIDPQRGFNGAPNGYYVRFKPGGRYLVAAFLRQPRPRTTNIAPTVFVYALRSPGDGQSMGVHWDHAAGSVATVTPAERAEIKAAGERAEAHFGRYMRTSRGLD